MCIQCALIAFTLHFSRNVRLLSCTRCSSEKWYNNYSSTIDNRDASLPSLVPSRVAVYTAGGSCCTAGVAVGFSTIT